MAFLKVELKYLGMLKINENRYNDKFSEKINLKK